MVAGNGEDAIVLGARKGIDLPLLPSTKRPSDVAGTEVCGGKLSNGGGCDGGGNGGALVCSGALDGIGNSGICGSGEIPSPKSVCGDRRPGGGALAAGV